MLFDVLRYANVFRGHMEMQSWYSDSEVDMCGLSDLMFVVAKCRCESSKKSMKGMLLLYYRTKSKVMEIENIGLHMSRTPKITKMKVFDFWKVKTEFISSYMKSIRIYMYVRSFWK